MLIQSGDSWKIIMQGVISFDTEVSDSGQHHIEGCYKLPESDWKVFYFTHFDGGKLWNGAPRINKNAIWQSGISGVDAVYPASTVLNKSSVSQLLSDILGDVTFVEARGPDSLMLK